jgi:hypothetical protein
LVIVSSIEGPRDGFPLDPIPKPTFICLWDFRSLAPTSKEILFLSCMHAAFSRYAALENQIPWSGRFECLLVKAFSSIPYKNMNYLLCEDGLLPFPPNGHFLVLCRRENSPLKNGTSSCRFQYDPCIRRALNHNCLPVLVLPNLLEINVRTLQSSPLKQISDIRLSIIKSRIIQI